MDLTEARNQYREQFSSFARQKDILNSNELLRAIVSAKPKERIVTTPFELTEELFWIIRQIGDEFEIAIQYLTTPDRWNGPLDMDCITGVVDSDIGSIFYRSRACARYFNEDVDPVFRKIGLVGKNEGIVSIVRGTDKNTWYDIGLPYFRLHIHPDKQIIASQGDRNGQRENLDTFPFVVSTPVEYHKYMSSIWSPDYIAVADLSFCATLDDDPYDLEVHYVSPKILDKMVGAYWVAAIFNRNQSLALLRNPNDDLEDAEGEIVVKDNRSVVEYTDSHGNIITDFSTSRVPVYKPSGRHYGESDLLSIILGIMDNEVRYRFVDRNGKPCVVFVDNF